MIHRRKVRSDAKLEQLSAAQHERLQLWLDHENCSYTEAVSRVHQEFGLRVGRTALAAYYQRHVAPRYRDAEAEAAASLLARPAAQFDAAAVKQAQFLAWSALTSPAPDIDTAAKLLDLVRRAERKEIARRRLQLAERRIALRGKEAAHRACHRPPALQAAASVPAAPLPSPPAAPSTTGALPPSAAPSVKNSPNPPRYSPYFALNRSRQTGVAPLCPAVAPHSVPPLISARRGCLGAQASRLNHIIINNSHLQNDPPHPNRGPLKRDGFVTAQSSVCNIPPYTQPCPP